MKLGSLFDGSGGFPLAGSLCGIEPVWASEVEPYPIAVTRSRFPNMKHLGSVTDVHGGDIEPVDIITFGSPCQDLSVAGKRAGLKHEVNGDDETTRSGLFMEAVRIIKEMRETTHGEYPRYAIWENVPGAFSSNKGEDFRIVLEELIKIVEPTAVMPAVPKNGWPYADSYCGDGWSLAYRVFDAQYWGVPQRRRRIYLVLDLRGQRAGKVSFEREGVRGHFATFKTAGQGTAGDVADRAGAGDCEGEGNCLTPWDYQGKRVYSADGVFPTLYSAENSGQQQQAVCLLVMDTPENCKYQTEGYCKKIRGGSLPFLPYCVPYTRKIRSGCEGGGKGSRADDCEGAIPTYCIQGAVIGRSDTAGPGGKGYRDDDKAFTIDTKAPSVVAVPHTLKIRSGCEGGGKGDRADGGVVLYQPMSLREENWAEGEVKNAIRAGESKSSHCVVQTLPFDTTQVTSPQNGCNPKWGDPCHPLAAQGHPPTVICKCYDARGNGDGQTVNTLTGDHENRITDYTSVVCEAVRVQYIVRRLTPTECARLQGFPDDWGHPDHMEDFTDEEYRFWLNVRNTHAAINGKPQKDYTKAQMLTWYNKLHTDSSEYKMWGNGISLPTALYVMQGIAEECQ